MQAGDEAYALQFYPLIAPDFPNSAAVQGYLGMVLLKSHDAETAARHFEVATHLVPGSKSASLGYFNSLWQLGHERDAKRELLRYTAISSSKEHESLLKTVPGKTAARAIA